MNWEELKEKAKELFSDECYDLSCTDDEFRVSINENEFYFRKYGDIKIIFGIGRVNVGHLDICYNRNYDQMYQIMSGLEY